MNINSIINFMDNIPSEQVRQDKMLLNKEFKDKAHIKGLVSYIYYPYQGTWIGHCELEIEGNSYTLTNMIDTIKDIIRRLTLYPLQENRSKPLSRMIEWTRMGYGLPFLRFNISVTPNQLNELRKSISKTNGIICSIAVALILEKCADFKIPLPLPAISPLTSALYLAAAKKFGSQRIYQIESYGNSLDNLTKIIKGVAMEAIGFLSVIIYQDDHCMEYLVLASALYLATDKKFGSQCIYQIKNLPEIIKGVAMEAIGFLSSVYEGYFYMCRMQHLMKEIDYECFCRMPSWCDKLNY